ncbi:MAG: hypothetical protein ACREF5_01860 [Candidatus Saccharimonadales bacterium]
MEPTNPSEGQPTEKPITPVMDVVAPQPLEATKAPVKDEAQQTPKNTKKPSVAKPPKQPGSGVGLAISATVIIVLGLAALMVYAYLKTKN